VYQIGGGRCGRWGEITVPDVVTGEEGLHSELQVGLCIHQPRPRRTAEPQT
jgi:hypothetical protein